LKLPVLYGREIIKALSKSGFYVVSQKGSHVKLRKKSDDRVITVVVPVHANKPVKRALLRKIIKDAKLTVDEFCRLL